MTPPPDVADGDKPPADRLESARTWLESADRTIITYMDRLAVPVLRIALGVVFIWFGGLKVIGGSPAADLVAATVYVVPPELFVPVLGIWEVIIGICLLYRPLIRLGILLLFLQMPGTFLPIVLLPSVVFHTFPYGLTVEGQYIVKNLVIIGAALVVGSTVRKEDKRVTEDVRQSDAKT
ncbi:DoxX family protein [Natrialbaceae archaeon A-CW2]|uniref:DoxX family protein n=1 Tax=Natronosalvus amylolyticus TaxID=2961994 RepID=UPI0028805FC2|nr:DoxX family protein [Natronosalvus amylolyticus]